MTPPAPSPERSRRQEPEPPPGDDLQALLWVLAALLATMELAWWLFARMYG